MPKILLVDDEQSILGVLGTLLRAEGYEVTAVEGGDKALPLLRSDKFDLMLSDIRMNPVNGIEVLKVAHAECPDMAVIMLTAFGSVETAIEALKLGAFDYVTKPFKVDELLLTVERALDFHKVGSNASKHDLAVQVGISYRFGNLVAESTAMRHVCDMVERIAPTDITVLISGESGSGKETVARAIHQFSGRRESPFNFVHCGSMSEHELDVQMFGYVKGAFEGADDDRAGLYQQSDGGTFFINGIESLPLSLQGKLLHVLQDKQVYKIGSNTPEGVNVRLLAATSGNLEMQLEEGSFREDLFYRISVVPIEIRALTDRREDVLPLAYHALRLEVGEDKELPSMDKKVHDALTNYHWPGNVRELVAAIKHAVANLEDGVVVRESLPKKIQEVTGGTVAPPTEGGGHRAKSLKSFLRTKERDFIHKVLDEVNGDREAAAKTLKMTPAGLERKLVELED